MTIAIPAKLYKYQSFKKNPINNIRERTIWFSKPCGLNDPFDMSISIRFGRKKSDFQELADFIEKDTGLKPDAKHLTNGLINQKFISSCRNIYDCEMKRRNEMFQQWGVASFSEIPDNILLWSHYADGHKGFCIEFDTSYFPFINLKKVHKVIYRDSYPYVHPKYVLETNEFPFTSLITKSKKWKYEQEWRILSTDGDTSIVYEINALTSICFGCLMPADQISKICQLLKNSNITFYKMKISDKTYRLIPEIYKYK